MPEIEIRPAIATDIPHLMQFEHNYTSDYVWQMEVYREEAQVNVTFRQVRLPRSVQVTYPRDPRQLADTWTQRAGLLVAILQDELVGYIGMNLNSSIKTTWVTDLVVAQRVRRQGIGSALVVSAQEWASQHSCRRLILEVQPKNHAAIRMATKLGFELCGYNDHYFANLDIALFFSKWLR